MTARGVIRVVNANMERAIRVITVERGFDPRDFALLAFGGAGPMHACELALDLGIRHIVFPRNPGLLCAWGALGAPLGREYSLTIRDASPDYRGLHSPRGADDAARGPRLSARRSSARGYNTNFSRTCVIADSPMNSRCALRPQFIRDFHAAHQRSFGHSSPSAPVEAVNLRLRSSVAGPTFALHKIARTQGKIAVADDSRANAGGR